MSYGTKGECAHNVAHIMPSYGWQTHPLEASGSLAQYLADRAKILTNDRLHLRIARERRLGPMPPCGEHHGCTEDEIRVIEESEHLRDLLDDPGARALL